MTPEQLENLKVGDKVIIPKIFEEYYGFDEKMSSDIEGIVLYTSPSVVTCLVPNGWNIEQSDIDRYKLDQKYLGKKAWYFEYEYLRLPPKICSEEDESCY